MMILHILKHELKQTMRRSGDALLVLAFFIIVATLFPFAIGTDAKLLHAIGAGIIWVATLLAMLLSLPSMFQSDHSDGTLEQWVTQPIALEWVVLSKMLAHWLMAALPIIILTPLIATLYDLPLSAWKFLLLSLLGGTPVLISIGTIGAALTTGLKRAGGVLAIIVLPLCIPVLIFGSAVALASTRPEIVSTGLLLLTAASLAAIPLASFFSAKALKNSLT